jgi:hypothetical protein
MSTHQDSPCWQQVSAGAPQWCRAVTYFLDSRDIVLPVAALLKQYKEHPESSMIRHFDLMFIQQSIGKLSSSVSRSSFDMLKICLLS